MNPTRPWFLWLCFAALVHCSDGITRGEMDADQPDGQLGDGGLRDGGDLDADDGCVAQTCAQLGAECGQVSDGCGGTLDCDACQAPQTCGGGGTANACGCATTPCSPLTEAVIYQDSLDDPTQIPLATLKGNAGGQVVANPGGGSLLKAAFDGAASIVIDAALLPQQENLHIRVEFRDDGADTNADGAIDLNEHKTTLIEIGGQNVAQTKPARFYLGINYDGGLRDPAENRHVYCVGSMLGDIQAYDKTRRCLPMGVNRSPRARTWIALDIYVTEVGTYALVDGIPTAPFGRAASDRSDNKQITGLFTELKRVEEIAISNRAYFTSSALCDDAQQCSTGRFRNLRISKIDITGGSRGWLYTTTLRYFHRHPGRIVSHVSGFDPGLKYRLIAEEMLLSAFAYRLSRSQPHLDRLRAALTQDLPAPPQFASELQQDIATGDVLKKLRVGQPVYSLGMTYLLASDQLTATEQQKLLDLTEAGLLKLIDQVKFSSGTRPCAVSQGTLRASDSRMEEDMWKVGGLAVGLALPLSSGFPHAKSAIEDTLWTCLNEAFARSDDPNRPQAPGWNMEVLVPATGEAVMANHGYASNADYAVCSALGNLLRANVALAAAQARGHTLASRDYQRAADTGRLWLAYERVIGLSNRGGRKYMNPQDYLFCPFTQEPAEPGFTQKLPAYTSGATIPWDRGYDDWGATGRWCTSGFAQVKAVLGGSSPLDGDLPWLTRVKAYVEEHGLTFPAGCYRTNSTAAPGFRCHYGQTGVDTYGRHRGLDLGTAHRDLVTYLQLYGLPSS